MFGKIFTSQKAQSFLRKHYLEDEQKYILKKIKENAQKGYDSLSLFFLTGSPAMEKRAFKYLKAHENWIKELGYRIEIIFENEMIISWGNFGDET
ncbi:hypothetical protein IL308_10970 [Lactococcus lactis]|uniref:hypothetical protein n=1 Tax=Lactococcus lactis TaxID=1358 RepID=UPI00191130BA|nr:hypothetical protein [Lactococcus lactis]MBK5077275.1 hypothetical protein [Lactococcus lactis]WDA67401.1 hypothetical protein IL310_00625 [Lactococcus lactis]